MIHIKVNTNYFKEDYDLRLGFLERTILDHNFLYSIITKRTQHLVIVIPSSRLIDYCTQNIPKKLRNKLLIIHKKTTVAEINKYYKTSRTTGGKRHGSRVLIPYDLLFKYRKLIKRKINHKLVIWDCEELIKPVQGLKLDRLKSRLKIRKQILDIAEEFSHRVCFISKDYCAKYFPTWTRQLKKYKYVWDEALSIQPIRINSRYPIETFKRIILEPLQRDNLVSIGDRSFTKVLVYIESLNKILDIINSYAINPVDYRILSTKNLGKYRALVPGKTLTKYTFVHSGFKDYSLLDDRVMRVVIDSAEEFNLLSDLNIYNFLNIQNNYFNLNNNTFIHISNDSILTGVQTCALPISKKEREVQVFTTIKVNLIFNNRLFNFRKDQILKLAEQYKEGFKDAYILTETKASDIKLYSYLELVEHYLEHKNLHVLSVDSKYITIIKDCLDNFGKPLKNYSQAISKLNGNI